MNLIAKLDNSKIMRALLEAIQFLIEETHINASPAGIEMNAMDSSHVAMLLAKLPKDMFTEYKCDGNMKIGINVQDFLKILRRAKPADELHLLHDGKDPNTILIRMKSEKSVRSFKLKSKEIHGLAGNEEQIVQNFEGALKDKFTVKLHIEGGVLDEVIKDALIIDDIIKAQVQAAEKMLRFSASDESGELEIELELGGPGVLDADVKEDAEGTFSLGFLENIIKIQSIVDTFEVSFASNLPMMIAGKFSQANDGRIVYLLAPRVEEEEDEEFGDDFNADNLEESLEDDYVVDGDDEE